MNDEHVFSPEQLGAREQRWLALQEEQQLKREAFLKHLVAMAEGKTRTVATVWLPMRSATRGGQQPGRAFLRFYVKNSELQVNDSVRGERTLLHTSDEWETLNRIFDEEEQIARDHYGFASVGYEIGEGRDLYFLHWDDWNEQ